VESATLNFDFALRVYYNGNIVTSGSWIWDMNNNNEPMTVNVVSQQTQQVNPSPTVPELTPIIAGMALVTTTSLVLVFHRRERVYS
jgi:hypothetical protein